MNVVDVGCATWGADSSVDKLIERFHPEVLYGFDPYPEVSGGVQVLDGTRVVIERKAAWSSETVLSFDPLGSGTHLVGASGRHTFDAETFDLADFLHEQSLFDEVVLKMDCEGAEFRLIPHLTAQDAWRRVSLLLVEFHGDETRPPIPVPWEPWA